MNDDQAELIRAAFAELHREFAGRLPERIRVVAAAIRAAEASRDDAALHDEANGAAHRLRGSAGSYGFPAISAAAARIEEAFGALGASPTADAAATWATITEALTELELAVIEG